MKKVGPGAKNLRRFGVWTARVISCTAAVRYVQPGVLIFVLALLASIGVHLPIYQVLGLLADELLKDEARRTVPPEPSVIDFELATEDHPKPADRHDRARRPKKSPRTAPEPRARPRPRRRKPPHQPRQPLVLPEPPKEARPVQPSKDQLALEQKSDNPEVEPPPDARFIAEENRRVEKETVAKVTNLQRDDTPQAAAGAPEDSKGDSAEENVTADLAEAPGDERRRATAEEAQVMRETQPLGAGRAAGAALPERHARARSAEQPTPSPGSPAPGSEAERLKFDDGEGTLVIRRPALERGAGRVAGERPVRPGERAGSTGPRGADLGISYRLFEETFGAEHLRREREAYAAQRRTRGKGGERKRRWRKFRAAIENYVPNVRPGNQTALNAAASPFAAYLAAVHRRIHSEFALGFLRNLPLSGGPFDDPSLQATLEIVINADGSLHQVGVIRTSGLLPFDLGAFDAVMRAAPFATPPRKILSADGRVYVHWGFHRGPRQCGTFNASPFILRPPDKGTSPDGDAPLRDRGVPPVDVPGAEMGMLFPQAGRLFAQRAR